MSQPKEVEIKLRLDPEKLQRLAASKLFAGVDRVEKRYHTVYFDDAKHHLLKEGFELRVRRDDERSLQTLKTLDSVERGEWESDAANGDPSLKEVDVPGLSKLQKRGIALQPQFSLDVERRTWNFAQNGSCKKWLWMRVR